MTYKVTNTTYKTKVIRNQMNSLAQLRIRVLNKWRKHLNQFNKNKIHLEIHLNHNRTVLPLNQITQALKNQVILKVLMLKLALSLTLMI